MNQLATPGLGSLLAGRTLPGIGQLLLAITGFFMVTTWFVLFDIQLIRQAMYDEPRRPLGWLGLCGAGFFVAAWLWALFTSLSVRRSALADDPAQPPFIDEQNR